jgi:hypothetical protein
MKELIVSILRDALERARAAGQLTTEIPSAAIGSRARSPR